MRYTLFAIPAPSCIPFLHPGQRSQDFKFTNSSISLLDHNCLPACPACFLWPIIMCVCAKLLQSCPTLCNTTVSLPGSPVHGILQARILEWVAISSSRGSSQPRDRTHVYCTGKQILYRWATREDPDTALIQANYLKNISPLGFPRYFPMSKFRLTLCLLLKLLDIHFPFIGGML